MTINCRVLGALGILYIGCSPPAPDYWNGTTADTSSDLDTDADTDADSDADTDQCVDDDGSTCGDATIDTDTGIWIWDGAVPDGSSFCGDPAYAIFISGTGFDFANKPAPYKGNPATAEVEITVVSHFLCGHCADFASQMGTLIAQPAYANRLVYYFRHYAFSLQPDHLACQTHRAAHSAYFQDQFWEMHDELYFLLGDGITEDKIMDSAAGLGLDMPQFLEHYHHPLTYDRLESDKAEAIAAGVFGTPTVFIEGIPVSPWANFDKVIDCLLGYSTYVDTD